MGLMVAVLELSAAFAGTVVLHAWQHGHKVTAFGLGATAALVTAQIGGIHLYTFALLLHLIVTGGKWQRTSGAVMLLASSAFVIITGFVGEFSSSFGLALQMTAMVITAVLLAGLAQGQHLVIAAYGFITMASAGSFAALLQNVGLLPEQLFQLEGAELHRPSGFYPEPDWLGLYAAAAIVLLFAFHIRAGVKVPLVLLNVLGMALASARAAILALLVVAVLAVASNLFSKQRKIPKNGAAVFALLTGALLFAVLSPEALEMLTSRISSALTPGRLDHNASVRIYQTDGLLAFAESAPWYGHGLSSAGRVNGYGLVNYSEHAGTTASNWLLGLWVDAKFLAIPLSATLGFLALKGNRAFGGRSLLVLVLVNSLFSNALFFPLAWFAIAQCVTRVVPLAPEADGSATPKKDDPYRQVPPAYRKLAAQRAAARSASEDSDTVSLVRGHRSRLSGERFNATGHDKTAVRVGQFAGS